MKPGNNFFLLISILLIVLVEKSFPYELSDTLVKLSDGFISSDEFLNRCDFSYPLKKNNISEDSLKKEFLYSLIAERLWASESKKMKLDTSSAFKSALDPIRKFYINDELYKEEITSKVNMSPKDISEGMARFRITLKLEILSSGDPKRIQQIYDTLLSGKTFRDLPKDISRTNDPVNIIFGQIQDENVEAIIYKLKTGYFTKPIHSGNKWFIFKLIERNKTDIAGLSRDAIRMNVEQIITRRRSGVYEEMYRDSLFMPLKIETNGDIFKKLCSVVSDILTERFNAKDWDTSKAVDLYQSDLGRIFQSIGEKNFEAPFILFDKDPLSLREALSLLPYKPFKIKYPSLNVVTNIFKAYFRYVIEQEVFYREALKANIQYRRNVQDNISIWKKSFQAGMYSAEIWNQINRERKEYLKDSVSTPEQKKRLFEDTMEKKTASLFMKDNIKINTSLLHNLKISPLNTYTIQNLGFGNQIPAFPIIVPYYDWIFRLAKNPLP